MSLSFSPPNPVLIINDETKSFVMTHQITRVVYYPKSNPKSNSLIYLRHEGGEWVSRIESPLTPEELYLRLFNLEET